MRVPRQTQENLNKVVVDILKIELEKRDKEQMNYTVEFTNISWKMHRID